MQIFTQHSADHHSVPRLKEFCRGKELQQDAVGAMARFFRDGPGGIDHKTIDDLKTACQHYGPNVTMVQVDAALMAAGLVEVDSDSPTIPQSQTKGNI